MTMKTKKTLQHIAAVAVVLLALCLVFAAPVSAEVNNESRIGGVEYATLEAAIADAENNAVIELIGNVEGSLITIGDKNLTIQAGEGYTPVVTGSLTLTGVTTDKTITVKNLTFENSKLSVSGYQTVTVANNKFFNCTVAGGGGALTVTADNIIVTGNTVKNVTSGNSDGIHVEGFAVLSITNNFVDGTASNSITANNGQPGAVITITGNTLQNWGQEDNTDENGNAGTDGYNDGRALRSDSLQAEVTFNNNVMINDEAPEHFVKITRVASADVSQNYWNGQNPTGTVPVAGNPYYLFNDPGNAQLIKSYYADEAKTELVRLFAITYHANNGTTPEVTSYHEIIGDETPITLVENGFTKENHFFVGWNATSPAGLNLDYIDGESFDNASVLFDEEENALDLYAIWAKADVEGVDTNAAYNAETGVTTATFTNAEVVPEEDEIFDSYPENSTTITLSNGAQLTLVFEDATNNSNFATSPTSLNAPIVNATVAYPVGNASLSGALAGTTSHFVAFEMSNLTTIPTISGLFNTTVENAIKSHVGAEAGILAMISADGADNSNITAVYVEFAFYPHGRLNSEDYFSAYHVKSDGTVEKLVLGETFFITKENTGTEDEYWLVALNGDGFSSYAVGYVEPEPTTPTNPTTPSPGGNGGNGGGSGTVVKPDTPTEVPPTEEPTDDPTDVPGEQVPDVPVTPEQPEEPASPAPVLAVLAALGAAVVLRRK